MNKVQLRLRAIQLRESGFSYNEILKEVNVPKSTLAYWVKDIPLDNQQIALMKSRSVDRQKRGRFTTSIALRARKVYRDKNAYDEAGKEFTLLRSEPLFMAGISLYWARGGKKSGYFQFISADKDMILFMLNWIEKFLPLEYKQIKLRLFVQEPNKSLNIEDFWARNLSIRKDSFRITRSRGKGMQNNPNYKGSCMILITNIAVYRKVLAWQNQFIKYYKEIVFSAEEMHP
jgi:hypothetical protein